jgi:hypothetical protein
MNDAQALRRDLQNAGVDPRELDQILRDLRQFDNDQTYVDPRSLAILQASAREKLKTEGSTSPLGLIRCGYGVAIRLECVATACQRPFRRTKTSVHRSCPLQSLPSRLPLIVLRPVTIAVSPMTCTL